MLNMTFDTAVLSTAFVKLIEILRFLQYKDYKNILRFAQLLCFDGYFFIKMYLLSIMIIVFSYSTWASVSNSHFNINLNDEEMIISHLMGELLIKQLFYDKNIIKLFERKKNNRKTLTKHFARQNHFVIAEFRIQKCLKG